MKDQEALKLLEPKRAVSEVNIKERIQKATIQDYYSEPEFVKAIEALRMIPDDLRSAEEQIQKNFIELDRLCAESEKIREEGKNSAQNMTYENLKEQKNDVIDALSIMDSFEVSLGSAGRLIEEENEVVKEIKDIRQSLVDRGILQLKRSVQSNLADKQAAYLSATASARASRNRVANILSGLICIPALVLLYGIITSNLTFWTVFVAPILILVGLIVIFKKRTEDSAKKILKMSESALNGIAEQESRLKKLAPECSRPYQEHLVSDFLKALQLIDQANLGERFKAEMDREFKDTIAAEKHWEEVSPKLEEKKNDYLVQRYAKLWGEFYISIPEEFRNPGSYKELRDLLVQKRADSLKEAYPILEVRQRERRRDAENEAFRASQQQLAMQQANDQRRAAEYAKQQAASLLFRTSTLIDTSYFA